MNLPVLQTKGRLELLVNPEIQQRRDEAVAAASLIVRVDSASTQNTAVDAQKELKRLMKLVEDARVQCKSPALDYGRAVDKTAKDFVGPLLAEDFRIARLIGNFQAEQLELARKAEAERLAKLQAEVAAANAAIAAAPTPEAKQAIADQAEAKIAQLEVPISQPKAAGQVVRETWDYQVVDIWKLVKARPDLCNITVKRRETLEVLAAGVRDIPGLRVFKEVKSGVRIGHDTLQQAEIAAG